MSRCRSHEEALARLVDAIACARRQISFFAGAGLGKSVVLRRAIAETRHPRRRFAVVRSPSSREHLLGGLADALGLPFAAGSDESGVWRSLVRAMRAATFEGSHVVFRGRRLGRRASDPAAIRDLTALVERGRRDGSPVSLIRVGRVEPDGDDAGWPAIGLERLTRSEAETYLDARSRAAGCRERVFTPRALTRLHAWSQGVPRELDRLAAAVAHGRGGAGAGRRLRRSRRRRRRAEARGCKSRRDRRIASGVAARAPAERKSTGVDRGPVL